MADKRFWGGPEKGWVGRPTVKIRTPSGKIETVPTSEWESGLKNISPAATKSQRNISRMWFGTAVVPKGLSTVQRAKPQPSAQSMLKNTLSQAFKPVPQAGKSPIGAYLGMKTAQPKQNVTSSKLSDPNYLLRKFLGR